MQGDIAEALSCSDLSAAEKATKEWCQVAIKTLGASQCVLFAAQTGHTIAKREALKASTLAMQAAARAVTAQGALPSGREIIGATPSLCVPTATRAFECSHDRMDRGDNKVAAWKSYLRTLAEGDCGKCQTFAENERLTIIDDTTPAIINKGMCLMPTHIRCISPVEMLSRCLVYVNFYY